MKTLEGVTIANGDDVTSEYLSGDLVENFFLYDVYYDKNQPPYFLTNKKGGADIVKMFDDGSEEERHYIEAAVKHGAIGQKSTGQLSSSELTIFDQFKMVESLFRRSDMTGCLVVIYQLFGNQTAIWPNRGIQYQYRVSGYSIQGNVATLNLSYGLNLLRASVGRKIYRTCPWRFGGSRCGYKKQDGEICSKTFEACARKGNLRNFGGCPGLMHGNTRRV